MEKEMTDSLSTSPKNTQKKAVLSDTKLSLAKWFCERILRYKTTNNPNLPTTPLTPTTAKKIEDSNICEQSVVSFENFESTEDNALNDIIIDCLNESRLSIGLVGDNSAALMNSILFQTTVKKYEKEYETPPKSQGPEQCVLTLSMDEKFKVNWAMEEKNTEPFLLLEELENHMHNTMNSMNSMRSSTFTFQYGEVPELIVGFKKESEFLHPGYVLGTIKPLLGKQIRFCGLGKNIQVDRIYIRERLKEIRTKYEAYTENFLIRMPSSFLKGNKELIFYDGLRGSQIEQAQKFQFGINCLSCIVDDRGVSPNLRSFIISSGFIHKLFRNPKEFNIIFLVNNRNNFTLQQPSLVQLQTLIRNQFLDILKEHVPSPYTSIIGNLVSRLKIIFIDTKLSTPQFDEEQHRKSGIPVLVSTINNISIGKCADSIRTISDDWISKNKDILNDFSSFVLNSNQPKAPSSHPLLEGKGEIPATVKSQFDIFKKELLGKVKSIDNNLLQQAHEAFHSATSQLHTIIQDSKLSGDDVNSIITSSLMNSAPAFWKKEVLEILPKQMEKIVFISSTLLKECVKSLGYKEKDPTAFEKVRLKRLMEFCELLHQRTATRISEISKTLFENDPDQVVLEACKHAISSDSTDSGYDMDESLKKISIEAAYNIKKEFSKILGFSIAQLSDIEKDIYQSANLVMVTLQTEPSTFKNNVNESHQPLSNFHSLIPTDSSVQLFKCTPNNSNNNNSIEPWAKVSGTCCLFPPNQPINLFDSSNWSLISFANNSVEDKDRFNQQLRSIGLSIKPPFDPIDSNSQFKALASQAYGSESVYPVVRLLIISEILSNIHDYECYVRNIMDIQEYIFRMSKDGENGDFITLSAFANYYQADLLIYSPILQHPLLIKSRDRTSPKVFCLAYMSDNSYFSLVNSASENSRKRNREISSNQIHSMNKRTRISESLTCNFSVPVNSKLNDENVEIEILGNKFSSISLKPRISLSSNLTNLCISTILNNIGKYQTIGGLPEHLIQTFITQMVSNRLVSIANLTKLLNHSKLQSLDLSYCNQLTVPICESLSFFTHNLQRLNLSHNVSISCEALLSLVKYSKNIEMVDIRGCYKVDDRFIHHLTRNCANLKYLNLQGCVRISDRAISELLQVNQQLRVLILRECNQISDESFIRSKYYNLREIDLTDCIKISDSAIGQIASMNSNLMSIKLTGKDINDASITSVALNCKKLQTFEVSHASITDKSIHELSKNCKSLHTLKVSVCREITVDAFRPTSDNTPLSFPSLKSVDFTRTSNITDRTLGDLLQSVNTKIVEELNFTSCEELSDRSIMNLVKIAGCSIKVLNLSKCPKITDDALLHILKYCPKLEKLSLYNCPLITDHSITQITKYLQQFKYLDLSSCDQISADAYKTLISLSSLESFFIEESNITDETLCLILKNNPNLHTLKLSHCKAVSDHTIECISTYCHSLKDLDLSYCSNVSISAIQSALYKLNDLKDLNLRGFNNLTVDGFEHPNLISLNLSWCKNIEDAAIAHIAKGCPSLIDLDLAWCGKISKYSVYQLAKECCALRSLNVNGCTNVPFAVTRYLSNLNLTTY